MKKMSVVTGLCVVTLSVALSGCSSKTESKPAASASNETSSAAPSSLVLPDKPTGPHMTIADYVEQNKIIEAPVTKDEPGAPTVHFAMPPDWVAAGARKPAWAYGAIVYDKAKNPADPPFMTAIYSKLTGNVDAAKVLEYAPGMLENLPGYEQDGDFKKETLSGFESIAFQGSYLQDNVRRYIAQKTVVIPKGDALFVLQLNADAPLGQDDVIKEAAGVINRETKITV
ncbi:MAG: LpqN/LpqT family lipoprotein [Mycobacterium sp.]|nr:LpqN/LpqT family lipoprotein [Mycobacterium sp.]